MPIERGQGVAVWRQVQEALEREIREGALGPGDRLPTEAALSERFGVNRHTIRRALSNLRDRGLIRIEQGRGTFVQEPILDYVLSSQTQFRSNVMRQRKTPGSRVLRAEADQATPEVARVLRLEPGAPVWVIESVGLADGRPVSVGLHIFGQTRLPRMIEAYRATGSITEALRRHGVAPYYRLESRITSALPSIRDAELLEQPRARPILRVESVNVDAEGRPIEFGLTRISGDRVHLLVRPEGTPGAAILDVPPDATGVVVPEEWMDES